MRGVASGVVGYRAARGVRAALALAAGAAALGGGAAQADEAGVAVAAEISGVTVTGARQPLDQDTGLATALTTVRETPQAISVIDQAQLKAQGVNTLEQALRNVPGITIAIGEGGTLNGDQFKIRGFDSKDDVYVDGLRDFGVYTRDSFAYEEVQVLKGPSGAMFGRGTTGGAINTLSKQPKLDGFNEVDLYAGNGDYYRALVDVDHRLGETSAVRLNLMGSNTGVVDRDLIYSKRWGAALSGAYGLGTDTTVVASYLHQHDHRRPDYGIIVVQPPGAITAKPASEYDVGVERSSFLGFRNDVDRTDADILTVRVTHEASAHLTFTSDTRYGVYSRYFQYSTLDQCNAACTTALFDNNPATEAFGGIGGSSPYQMDAWGLQNISTAHFDGRLGGLHNEAIVGIDLSKQVNDKTFFAYTLPPKITTRPNMPHPIVNPDPVFPAGYGVFTPVPGQNLDCSGAGNCTTNVLGPTVFSNVTGTQTWKSNGESTDYGVFFTDRLWLTEELSVIGSLRYDRYEAKLDQTLYSGAASPPGGLKVNSDLTSPRVSLVYAPNPDQTWYASWGRSQTPQGTSIVGAGTALTISAKDLEPEDSEIIEVGAKVTIPHTRLLATASVFRITKDNALQVDPATGFLQAQSGERQEVKGVEVGLTGRITPEWTLSAGYSYLDARIEESFANCTVPTSTTGTPTNIVCPVGVTAALPVLNPVATGKQVAFVPKHSATLFTTYDLSEWVDGLSVGGDVIYQSKLFLTYTARSLSYADRGTLVPARIAEVPESVTLDAFASLVRGPYRLSVNLYNLADRLNYTQVFSNRAIPAPGRTVIVSIGARF
jgi:catecholate siderophore receptor